VFGIIISPQDSSRSSSSKQSRIQTVDAEKGKVHSHRDAVFGLETRREWIWWILVLQQAWHRRHFREGGGSEEGMEGKDEDFDGQGQLLIGWPSAQQGASSKQPRQLLSHPQLSSAL
jgi:hypothetical protein